MDVAALRTVLDREGLHGAEIQSFGAPNEFVIRARVAKPGTDANDTQATAEAVRQALTSVLGADNFTILRTEAVGPKVGGELRQKAFLAIFLSFFAVLAYLAYRFEWRFGLAAVVATLHDILATIAFIGIHAARGEPHGRGRGALDGGVLAQRHDHHLRPRPREPEEAQEGDASSRS